MRHLLTQAAIGLEVALVFSGLWLLWRTAVSPEARRGRPPALLLSWGITWEQFGLFLWLEVGAAFLAQLGTVALLHALKASDDILTLVGGSSFDFGLIAAFAVFYLAVLKRGPRAPEGPQRVPSLLAGIGTFIMVLPIVYAVGIPWEALLSAFHLPVESQDVVGLFLGSHSLMTRGLIVILAVVVAPVAEELLFRAGLFRFLRQRAPAWVAVHHPSRVFAALHVSWQSLNGLASFLPLTALAMTFSYAYERTGRLSTTIIAHALFNLHTIALVICGVSQGA